MIDHFFDGYEGGFYCFHEMPNGQQCGQERIKHNPPPFNRIYTAIGCELDHLACFYFDQVKRSFQEPDEYFRKRLLLCAGIDSQQATTEGPTGKHNDNLSARRERRKLPPLNPKLP